MISSARVGRYALAAQAKHRPGIRSLGDGQIDCARYGFDRELRAGHGFTENAKVAKEELINYRKATKAVIDEVTRLYKAGVSEADAIKQANWGEYGTWSLARSQGPVAVRKIYEELSGKLK